MKVNYDGRGVKLDQNFKNYAQEKLDALEKFISADISTAKTTVEVIRNKHHRTGGALTCQITMWFSGTMVRAENTSDGLNEVFDLSIKRVKAVLEKHHAKSHIFSRKFKAPFTKTVAKSKEVIRRKTLEDLKPMSEKEAIMQIDLLNHDFLAYLDESGEHKVLYKRKSGGYGIIEF